MFSIGFGIFGCFFVACWWRRVVSLLPIADAVLRAEQIRFTHPRSTAHILGIIGKKMGCMHPTENNTTHIAYIIRNNRLFTFQGSIVLQKIYKFLISFISLT